MGSVNEEKIRNLIAWYDNDVKGEEYYYLDRDFFEPIMDALGDDIGAIIEYLNSMDIDDLDTISGCFEDIYRKFMTDDVWDALEKLEKKIDEESTRMKEFRKREEAEKQE